MLPKGLIEAVLTKVLQGSFLGGDDEGVVGGRDKDVEACHHVVANGPGGVQWSRGALKAWKTSFIKR